MAGRGMRLLKKGQKGIVRAVFSRIGLMTVMLLLHFALFFAAFTEPEPTPFKGHFNEITLSVIYQPLCEIFCLFILFMGFKTDAGKD